MENAEFLHTKDPLFFTKPELIEVQLSENGGPHVFQTFCNADMKTKRLSKRLTAYNDNECNYL